MTTAADLKQQLKGLETRRSHLEIEVSLARARLEATGLGMDEPLVDSEVGMRGQKGVDSLSRVYHRNSFYLMIQYCHRLCLK